VRVLFIGDDAVPGGRAEARAALNSCEITEHPFGCAKRRRGARCGHLISLL